MKHYRKTDSTAKPKSKIDKAIDEIKHSCPTAWQTIGEFLRSQSFPHQIQEGTKSEDVVRLYIIRSTYGAIAQELGFFDKTGEA